MLMQKRMYTPGLPQNTAENEFWGTLFENKPLGSCTSWEVIGSLIHGVVSQLENRWITTWEKFGEILEIFESQILR